MTKSIPLIPPPQSLSSAVPLAGAHEPVRSLYIHIPFCFHKCHYCDFYSLVDTQDRQAVFVETLIKELAVLSPHAAGPRAGGLDTIFIGGGTPTLLVEPLWRRLLASLHDLFAIGPDTEFTVECNPETASASLFAVLRAGGVNRLSIGAQSFDHRHLKTLERWHDPENVARALALGAQAGITRRSIDLIFAVPGQSIEEWRHDLEQALSLCGGVGSSSGGVEHLSCYALTYEPNTPLTARRNGGAIVPVDEDTESEMFQFTGERLRDAGLQRYEISNFSLPGAECRHNLAYWRHEQWLAAGPSASAFVGGHRWKNVPRLADWLSGVRSTGGHSPIVDHEPPDSRRLLSERVMTGLRLNEGLDACRVLEDARPLGAASRVRESAGGFIAQGLLLEEDDRWRLSPAGLLMADGVAAAMMACLD